MLNNISAEAWPARATCAPQPLRKSPMEGQPGNR
jgi:hypothetical protein